MRDSADPGEGAATLSARLAGHAEALVADLLPGARRDGREMVCGSLAGEPGRSLRVGLSGRARGQWRDWATGEHGDLLDLVAATRCGGDLRAAMCRAREWLGDGRPGEQVVTPRQAPEADVGRTTLSEHGRRFWSACRAIVATDPAGRYLAARGCAVPHVAGDLRWHPALQHPCGHVGPALVALVTDARTCEPLSLHRTWIAGDGSGRKASIERPRLLFAGHRKAGGVIRLWPDDEVTLALGVAEGVETALALARGFRPVWAAIDAGNLAALPYLHPIEAITVAVDHDPAGQKAYAELAERWTAAGAEVRPVLAPWPGDDLADWCAGVDDAA